MRNKICLLGTRDILEFLNAVMDVEGRIEIYSPSHGYRVSARSLLGLTAAMSEWGDDIWIDSEPDIYSAIEKFIVIADNDAANIHD